MEPADNPPKDILGVTNFILGNMCFYFAIKREAQTELLADMLVAMMPVVLVVAHTPITIMHAKLFNHDNGNNNASPPRIR